MLLVVLAVLVGAAGAVLGLYGAGAFSTTILAEPVRTPGVNPFMPPVGTDELNVIPPPGVGLPVSGGLSGLYGGTLNNASCDPEKMIGFLQANPDKAAAWASVQGISPADIPRYVAELTPLVLRSDTAVTNHGFRDGKATTLHSVLQAGTAVLVDKSGVPRARCMCGNPLTPGAGFTRPTYQGQSWAGFSPAAITSIRPEPKTIIVFVIIDVKTGSVFNRPAGTRGERDQAEQQATPSPSPPSPPAQSGAVPAGFVGNWSGSISQQRPPTPPSTLTVTISQGVIGSTIGSGYYTGDECNVHWTLLRANAGQIIVNEVVDSGTCFNNIEVTLTDRGDGTLGYDFEAGNGQGVLSRR